MEINSKEHVNCKDIPHMDFEEVQPWAIAFSSSKKEKSNPEDLVTKYFKLLLDVIKNNPNRVLLVVLLVQYLWFPYFYPKISDETLLRKSNFYDFKAPNVNFNEIGYHPYCNYFVHVRIHYYHS